MARLPDRMVDFATLELEEALRPLTARQVEAIDAIIAAGHIVEEPPAPYRMLTGPDAICSRTVWARRPRYSDDGEEIRRPGWTHQPEFMHALNLAKRLARRRKSRRMVEAMDQAAEIAQVSTPGVIANLIGIVNATIHAGDEIGDVVNSLAKDADRVAAARVILDWAHKTAQETGQAGDSAADDWYIAADENDDEEPTETE